jgi:transposase
VEIIEMRPSQAGNNVILRAPADHRRVLHVALRDLLASHRARIVADLHGPSADDPEDPATVVLAGLTDADREAVAERAAHIREALTGYRSGLSELAQAGEPRAQFDPHLPLTSRYDAKAIELGVSLRTIKQWVSDFRRHGEAGLARTATSRKKPLGQVDERWVETALEVMVEHTDQSRPSRTIVIDRTNARVVTRFGPDVVKMPSRATAFRVLAELEKWHPTFRLSTKRNRDIADRPAEAYGKLRPTRPGGDMADMSGMMSPEEMTQLSSASGAEFDRMFLQMMIAHHQGAVTDAQQELSEGMNEQAKALASNIVTTQTVEINRMQQLLQTL